MDNTDIRELKKSLPVSYIGEVQKSRKSNISVGTQMISELIPFKNFMKGQLRNRGYNVSGLKFRFIVPLFFNEFVSNANDEDSLFQPVNVSDFINSPVFRFSVNDEVGIISRESTGYFVYIQNIVNAIIHYFKSCKSLYQAAKSDMVNPKEVLTVEQLSAAKAAIRIEKDLQDSFDNTSPVTMKNLKDLLIFAAIIYLLYYFTK